MVFSTGLGGVMRDAYASPSARSVARVKTGSGPLNESLHQIGLGPHKPELAHRERSSCEGFEFWRPSIPRSG